MYLGMSELLSFVFGIMKAIASIVTGSYMILYRWVGTATLFVPILSGGALAYIGPV